jgi:DNA-binding response OmpR family regulator
MENQKHLRIMAVDDDPFIRGILENFLRQYFDVTGKSNGQEAMEWLEAGHEVDLIIADVNMPEMSGYELLQQVRSSGFFRNIPFIILSGAKDSDEKIRCLRAGADDYVVKPFNPEELHIRIDNIFKRLKIIV